MKRILITGGNGFIGKHLRRFLDTNVYEVFAPHSDDLDVTHRGAWNKYRNSQINHLIHLAGKIFVPASWEMPCEFFEINMGGTLQALEFCRQCGIGLTYVSAYTYGVPDHLPVNEKDLVKPSNPYACSKHLGELLCKYYSELFDMDITVLRLFNVYGPGQSRYMLIPTVVSQILGESPEIIVNDIYPKRDYIYIDDVCKAVVCSIEHSKGFNIFNVGFGSSYSVGEVIDRLQVLCKTSKNVISRENKRKNELNDVVADIRNIQNAWGWKPSVALDDGLRKCVEWYEKNENSN